MLSTNLHQGSSLHSHTPEAQLQLIAVASDDTGGHTLETLWQVCSHLQRLGYPVIVLDGTAAESEEAPGLQDLLAHAPWGDSAFALPGAGADAASLAVLPAAHGLHALAYHAAYLPQPVQALQPLFRQFALVVLYAPVATLASPLLAGSPIAPLLIMQPGKSGIVDSYKQLKHLALHGRLSGSVACVLHASTPALKEQVGNQLHSLRQCAARHLGQPIATMAIDADNAHDMQRLALQLLESAGTINNAPVYVAPPAHYPSTGNATPFFQSH